MKMQITHLKISQEFKHIFQRIYASGQEAHEKMLNIIVIREM